MIDRVTKRGEVSMVPVGAWLRLALPALYFAVGRGYMKIHLLDPGLRNLRGHHFDLDVRLARALARRGHEVLICAAHDASGELGARFSRDGNSFLPVFRCPPYFSSEPTRSLRVRISDRLAGRRPKPADGVSVEQYRQVASLTAEDLARLPPADAWFWPTLSAYQLLAACSTSRVPQIGGAWWLPPFLHGAAAAVWADSAQRIMRERLSVKVGFYDEELCRRGESFSEGMMLERLPCPHDGADGLRNRGGVRRIGFFGYQRPARGRDLLCELLPILLQRGFEVVVQDSGGGDRYGRQAVVLPFIEDFAAELARCDVVIWPSRPDAYSWNLSGVVSECIASGVPVIMPSGCLPADMAARFDCAHYFHQHTCDSVLEALGRMVSDYPATLARCELARLGWRAVNGTDRLAERVEQLAGGNG